MKRLGGTIVLTILLGCLGGTISRVAAFMVDVPASKDNTLYEDAQGAVSNGAGSHFFVGTTASGSKRRGLIAFDIAGHLPAGAVITSVMLQLDMTKTIAGRQNITLHKVLANWGEGNSDALDDEGQGAPAAAADATWKHRFFPNTLWATVGGNFAATASATTPVDALGVYTWGSTPGMVADVQAWLNQPTSNFGWLLRGNEATTTTAKRFDTKESVADNGPLLTVEFSLTCAGQAVTILGTPGDDMLLGTAGADVIAGLRGNDVIYGLGGHDTICGGEGDDVIFGGSGLDLLLGEAGNDVLHGGPDADRLLGGSGHDILLGEDGDDILNGESGDDSLHGGSGNDQLVGGIGHDILRGDAGDDALNGGTNLDVCDGGSDTDTGTSDCDTSVNIP